MPKFKFKDYTGKVQSISQKKPGSKTPNWFKFLKKVKAKKKVKKTWSMLT